MNLINTVEAIKDISLNVINVKSFNVGNTWDQAASKGDVYPCVWVEFPVLTNYTSYNNPLKQMTFSIDVLDIAKNDDNIDEMAKISMCEQMGDVLIQELMKRTTLVLGDCTGLSVKNINADKACGMRFDVTLSTQKSKLVNGEITEGC